MGDHTLNILKIKLLYLPILSIFLLCNMLAVNSSFKKDEINKQCIHKDTNILMIQCNIYNIYM